MEVSTVRQRLMQTIDPRRSAADRRAATGHARLRGVSRSHGRSAGAPGGKRPQAEDGLRSSRRRIVRLMSDRSAEDFIEIALDTSGSEPRVMGHTSRRRGQRVVEHEQPIGGAVADLSENDVLEFLLKELEPFVER
jgi:hypothetical protein